MNVKKNTKSKKSIAKILVLVMIIGLLPTFNSMVGAVETEEAVLVKDDETEIKGTLLEVIKLANEGDTIKLQKDVTITDDMIEDLETADGSIINIDKNITIDGDGNSIIRGKKASVTNYCISVVAGKTLILNDMELYDEKGYKPERAFIRVKKDANLIFEDGTYMHDCIGSAPKKDSAIANGGVIYTCYDGTFTMKGGEISNCKNPSANGGAIYNCIGGNFVMDGGVISNCSAKNGGAVYGGIVTINKSTTIEECSATLHGGAIEADNVTINGGIIKNCTAIKNGGAIHSAFDKTLTINGGTIEGITSDNKKIKNNAKNGGAIFNEGDFVINGGNILSCNAENAGGAIFNDYRLFIYGGSVINKCNADNAGGAIFNNTYRNAELYINSNIKIDITGNKAKGINGIEDNVELYDGMSIMLSKLSDDSKIGITVKNESIPYKIADAKSVSDISAYAKCFISDKDSENYDVIVDSESTKKLNLEKKNVTVKEDNEIELFDGTSIASEGDIESDVNLFSSGSTVSNEGIIEEPTKASATTTKSSTTVTIKPTTEPITDSESTVEKSSVKSTATVTKEPEEDTKTTSTTEPVIATKALEEETKTTAKTTVQPATETTVKVTAKPVTTVEKTESTAVPTAQSESLSTDYYGDDSSVDEGVVYNEESSVDENIVYDDGIANSDDTMLKEEYISDDNVALDDTPSTRDKFRKTSLFLLVMSLDGLILCALIKHKRKYIVAKSISKEC